MADFHAVEDRHRRKRRAEALRHNRAHHRVARIACIEFSADEPHEPIIDRDAGFRQLAQHLIRYPEELHRPTEIGRGHRHRDVCIFVSPPVPTRTT